LIKTILADLDDFHERNGGGKPAVTKKSGVSSSRGRRTKAGHFGNRRFTAAVYVVKKKHVWKNSVFKIQ
jgi:hypothetical protein